MTATNHGLAGATIAVTMHQYPAIALLAAFASHFLLDSLPHFGDKHMDFYSSRFLRILSADMVIAVATTLLIAWFWQPIAGLVIVCAFTAASPDLMWIYYEYITKMPRDKRSWVARFHSWLQWSQSDSGAVIELLWYVVFLTGLIIAGGR